MDISCRPTPFLALLLAVALVAAGCADDADTAGEVDDTTERPTTSAEPDSPAAAFENPYADYTSEVYTDDELWHCRPDLTEDICDGDLAATIVEPDGSLTEVDFEVATDPGVATTMWPSPNSPVTKPETPVGEMNSW